MNYHKLAAKFNDVDHQSDAWKGALRYDCVPIFTASIENL